MFFKNKNVLYVYIVCIVVSIFLLKYGFEIYSLSVRAKSTEQLLKQYREREERSVKELGDSNRKLQEITIRVEQLGKDTEAIRYENIELRNQLQKYSDIIRNSEKQSVEIRTRLDNQSKGIDTGRAIIQRIQKRGYIKN